MPSTGIRRLLGHAKLLRAGLIALWCVAAAGCAGVKDPSGGRAMTHARPAPATAAAGPSAAEGTADSERARRGAAPEPGAPSAPAAETSRGEAAETSRGEATEPALVAPQTPAAREPEAFGSSSATPPSPDALDFASLVTRLRKTKAINLRTKVAVKNQSDDLLDEFRAYHTRHGTATLVDLRRSYDLLFSKLHALLEDADPPLARDIDRSRAAIWEILSDRRKFSASHLMAGA